MGREGLETPPYLGSTPVAFSSFLYSYRCKSLKFGINLKVMSCGSILVREESFLIRKWGVGAGNPHIFESAPTYLFNHSNACKSFKIGISLKAIICISLFIREGSTRIINGSMGAQNPHI